MRSVLALPLVAACLPAPVYRVQRTARVPHPAAPLRTGEPLAGPVELSIGASNVADVRTPRLADPQASVEVPSTQMRSELRFRVAKYGEIAAINDHAIEATMQPLDRTQAPVASGTAWSAGLAVRAAVPIPDTHLTIGLGVEGLNWNIPYVEYRSCIANCDAVPMQEIIRGEDAVATFAFAITPSYHLGALSIFGGLYAAQHPTIVRKGTEEFAMDYDSDLDSGRFNFVLHAGAEYRWRYLSVIAQLQDDVTRAPVWYGPSVGVALAAHMPELPRASPPTVHVEPDDRPW